ncbi:MAG TPA: hypothetical protein VNS22_02040 [Geminicoccus sp.]|uniref:hypothetical protein n=1 Tax=Geminicoccus sp. TaxID=2024832 RepID=UPI002BDF4D8C|nr:hypothetical protein [Geminicoccus sp.]HWL67143.1 hypothetical protein [Geminicoccus sp.]
MRASCLTLALLPLLPAGPAGGHDWYEGLLSPRGFPCCSRNDCQVVPYRLNRATGEEEIQVYGRWWPVDPRKVLALATPDGKVHACWDHRYVPPAERVTFGCIILPRMTQLEVRTVG